MFQLTTRDWNKALARKNSKPNLSERIHLLLSHKLKLFWHCPYCNRYHFRNKYRFDIKGNFYSVDDNFYHDDYVCFEGWKYFNLIKKYLDYKENEL